MFTVGLCFQDVLLVKLWMLITHLGPQCGLRLYCRVHCRSVLSRRPAAEAVDVDNSSRSSVWSEVVRRCPRGEVRRPNVTSSLQSTPTCLGHFSTHHCVSGTLYNLCRRHTLQKTGTRNLHEKFAASSSRFLAPKELFGQSHCRVHVTCWTVSVTE